MRFLIKVACPLFFCLFLLMTSGCIRLWGGGFYAKKGSEGEPPKVKKFYVDTDELLRGEKAPGKIEI